MAKLLEAAMLALAVGAAIFTVHEFSIAVHAAAQQIADSSHAVGR